MFCYLFLFAIYQKKNFLKIMQLLWLLTIIFSYRLIAFTVTHFPPATKEYVYKMENEPMVWNVLGFLITKSFNSCTDYMFSGHAVYFTLLNLSLCDLSHQTIEKKFFFIYTIVGIITIIASRLHYTVDVLIAIIISLYCYKYHAMKNKIKKNQNQYYEYIH